METEYDDFGIIRQNNSDRSAQVIQIDNGKHISAVAICAALCGIAAVFAGWSVYKWHEYAVRYRDDSVDLQMQYEKERNHIIELEARLKVLGDEVQSLKESTYVRR